jgi:hypothetical protein
MPPRIGVAVLAALPSEHRWRYRQEFLAELYGMPPAVQWRHASGVLSHVWTLRVALTEPGRLTPKGPPMAKPWRYRVRLHRWQFSLRASARPVDGGPCRLSSRQPPSVPLTVTYR